MSDETSASEGEMSGLSSSEKHERMAQAFGRSLDPLAKYSETLWEMDEAGIDPFELYVEEMLKGKHESTIGEYRRYFKQWGEHMASVDSDVDSETGRARHPACPKASHVTAFIEAELNGAGSWMAEGSDGNARSTVRSKITLLNAAYEYWQREASFPHPRDFNPFETAAEKFPWADPPATEPYPLSISEIREVVRGINNVRDRAVVALGFKLGLRGGEVRNIQLQDFHLSHPELEEHFPEMGTHPLLEGRKHIMVVPSREERPGNKSKAPSLIPLDDEMRRALVNYLLVRVDNGEPWLFLSDTHHEYIEDKDWVNQVWKRHFHPEYAGSERYEPVRSHYGRHWFTSYWKLEVGMERELIQYMRGDVAGRNFNRQAIDEYLHPNYERVESLYRENVFSLGL